MILAEDEHVDRVFVPSLHTVVAEAALSVAMVMLPFTVNVPSDVVSPMPTLPGMLRDQYPMMEMGWLHHSLPLETVFPNLM